MKIIGCILLIASTTAVGFYLSMLLKEKIMLFNMLTLLTVNLSTAIRYNGADISSLLKYASISNKFPMLDDIINSLENGDTLSDSWSLAVSKATPIYKLSKEDTTIITQFGHSLGTTDVDGQIEHLCYYKNIFQNKAKILESDYSTKARVYKSLGFFSGMAIALVII